MANPNPNWPSFPGVANMAQDPDGRPTTQDLIPGKQLGTYLDTALIGHIIRYLCDLRDAVDAESAAAISGVLGLLSGESPGLGLRSDAEGRPIFTDKANGQRQLALASQLIGLLSGTAGVPTGGSAGQALFSDATGQPQYGDGANGTRALALQSALAAEIQRAQQAEAAIFQLPVGAPILWGSNIIPAGMILYDGRSFPAAGNPQLAALFPFLTVPDMRGLVPRGYDPTGIHDPHGPTRGLLSFQDGTYLKGPEGSGWFPVTFGEASFPGNDRGLDYASATNNTGSIHNAQPGGGTGGIAPFNTGTSQLGLYGATRTKNMSWNFIARGG